MSQSHVLLRLFRQVHLYVGVFVSPALIFFAFTGAMQTFSLHETTQGSSYQPPKWAMVLAQIHKKATPVLPQRRPGGPGGRGAAAGPGGDHDHGDGGPGAGGRGGGEGHERGAAGSGGDHGGGGGDHDRGAKDGGGDHDHAPAGAGPSGAGPSGAMARAHHPLPLKIFFLLVSIGLFTLTLTGLYMSWKYTNRRHGLVAAIFIAGIVLPLVFVFV